MDDTVSPYDVPPVSRTVRTRSRRTVNCGEVSCVYCSCWRLRAATVVGHGPRQRQEQSGPGWRVRITVEWVEVPKRSSRDKDLLCSRYNGGRHYVTGSRQSVNDVQPSFCMHASRIRRTVHVAFASNDFPNPHCSCFPDCKPVNVLYVNVFIFLTWFRSNLHSTAMTSLF